MSIKSIEDLVLLEAECARNTATQLYDEVKGAVAEGLTYNLMKEYTGNLSQHQKQELLDAANTPLADGIKPAYQNLINWVLPRISIEGSRRA